MVAKNESLARWLENEALKHRCECGCGCFVKPTAHRWYQGKSLRFIAGHQNRGKFHPHYQGGEVKAKGYLWVLLQGHPRSTPRGYVKKCWLEAERRLGRFLASNEHVHHKDGDKMNDTLDNLEVLKGKDHHRKHAGGRERKPSGRFA